MRNLEIIPVIHVQNQAQVDRNIAFCIVSGIRKVMLIQMQGRDDLTLAVHKQVKQDCPDLWVGCNLLSLRYPDALVHGEHLEGIWTDQTVKTPKSERQGNFKGLLFGGVAFKYQPQPSDILEATRHATKCADVVTTSGVATGRAADLGKLQAMSEAIGGDALFAVASGVSEDNISQYKGIVDYVLVATSITDIWEGGWETICPKKLERLQNKNR